MNEPTAAERERARAFTNRVKINDGDLAQLLADMRAEHDVAAMLGQLGPSYHLSSWGGRFEVYGPLERIAVGDTPIAACIAALKTVKESP